MMWVVVLALVAQAFKPAIAGPTYTADIAPLINDRCGMCHHPSGSAPFSLLTYADVKRRAKQRGPGTVLVEIA